MRVIGVLLAAIALGIGIGCFLEQNEIPFGFILLFLGVILLFTDGLNDTKGIPKYQNPPAPPKKCICNDIGKHTPGGRCEAEHRKDGGSDLSSFIGRPEFPKDRTRTDKTSWEDRRY